MSRICSFIAGIAILLVGSGCVGNKMYRQESVEKNAGYDLAFIEFDDQGEMWDATQLSRALTLIERANEHPDGAVLLTYFHGWQHNASEKSEEKGNVADFKGFLQAISDFKSQRPDDDRPLVGIYFGWRGKSGTVPGINLLTFYGRSGAARRISGSTSTEAIYRLLATAKRNPQSKTMVMGHSFGGQIVEKAVTQAMIGEIVTATAGKGVGEINLPADLVVLINPAAKSLGSKQFIDMLDRSRLRLYRTDGEGNRHPVPLIVSITSTADLVTRWAFPAGTTMSSLGKSFHRYSEDSCMQFEKQKSFYIRTSGHNKALISHQLLEVPSQTGETPDARIPFSIETIENKLDPITGQKVVTFDGTKSRFSLSRVVGASNDTPYWIMQVPRSLIPGHSGFFTTDTLRLIGALLQLTGTLSPDTDTEVVREVGVRPKALASLPDGRVLVADASRRIYQVEADSPTPILYGCVPQLVDSGTRLGLTIQGGEVVGVRSRLTSKSSIRGGEEYRTELVRARFLEDGLELEDPVRIQSTERFSGASFDFEGNRVFLSTGEDEQIFVAELTTTTAKGKEKNVKPIPRPVSVLDAGGVISEIYYSQRQEILLALDGEKGDLWAIRGRESGPTEELLASGLGWPVQLAVDESNGRIYIGDAKEQRIFRVDCADDTCSEPRVLAQGDPFVNPLQMTVGKDGTLWVGDPEAEIIVAMTPEGEILQTIDRLPSE